MDLKGRIFMKNKRSFLFYGTVLVLMTALTAVPGFAQNTGDFQIEGTVLVQYNGTGANVTVPAGVTSIGEWAFSECTSLSSITLPAGLTSIGEDAFYGCTSLSNISIDANNMYFTAIGGVLYSKDQKTLLVYPAGKRDTSYRVLAGVTSIGESAFYGCTSLSSITLPAGKKYAVAAFADVGIYQILKYDPQTKTATVIPGKSLWFNVESKPYWDMYEYSREEELSIPQQLKPFEKVNVEVKEADLYKVLKTSHSETRDWDINDIGYFSKDETFVPDLLIPILKQFGYTKLQIDVSFDYRSEHPWYAVLNDHLRLQIANWNKTSELGRKEFGISDNWTRASFSQPPVSIDATSSETGEFKLLWSRDAESDAGHRYYYVRSRTITITALK
jgi:hypothetical protein